MERFANNADSVLNGAINNVTTSIVVVDGSPFPSTGEFRLIFGVDADNAEIVIATARSGNTITVIRGQEGTTAQSWADGTIVTHIVTAGAASALRDTLKGKTLNSSLETVGANQDGYALTWVNTDGYWAARPGSQWTTANANEIYTTKTVSIDGNGTLASAHGDGSSKLFVNGKILASSLLFGEIPLTTQGFGYVSDNTQTFTVPTGVTSIKIKMWGPGGGSGNYAGANGGGPGGYSTGLLSVTPGEVLTLVVGSGGDHPTATNGPGGLGGWPGGGFGAAGDASGAGGGGYTGIFTSSISQSNALMIAGGGGGATGFSGGNGAGAGGGLVAGGSTSGASVNGRGGTQITGGADGNGNGAPTTTIAAGSNGQTLPQSTINVAATTGFPTNGVISIITSTGLQVVTYTGTTGTTFTGCTGGTGTMSTGGAIGSRGTVIAAGSNGVSLPTGTINVGSTNGFPTSGTLFVVTGSGSQPVQYTGTTATTFTGCTGGTGTMSTGNSVSFASAGGAFTGGIAYMNRTSFQPTGDDSGGGGSGYFGGGSGKGDGRSGGGGSGFLHATRVTSGSTTTGTNANVNGGSTLPPNTTDANYISGVGIGGAATGAAGTDGGDGYIVFIWGGQTSFDQDSIDFPNAGSITTNDLTVTFATPTNGTAIVSAPGATGGITLAPGSGTITLQSAADFIMSSGTSSLVFNANSAQKLRIYPAGAIVVGPPEAQNDTSAEAQINLTGPVINISTSTGSFTSNTNQAAIFNAAGALNLQGHTEVRFNTNTSLRGYFDSNGILRAGPSANITTTIQGASSPFVGTDYLFVHNASGSAWGEFIAGANTNRAAVQVMNTGPGASATVGVSLFAAGTAHATTEYNGNGIIEQSGASTSGLIFTKMVGNGTGFASTGAIWQSGAWTIGRATNNDTSTEAQAGLTGPLINITASTGTATSVANQSLIYNTAGTITLQGHAGAKLRVNTTDILSATSTGTVITGTEQADSFIVGSSGPTITKGTGPPATSVPDGSLFLRTDGTSITGLYTRQGGTWFTVGKDGYGTFASRPASATANAGSRFITSDGITEFVDIGTEWKPLIQGRLGKQPPLVSNFTAITSNSKSASYVDQAGTLKITWTHTSAGEDLHILKKSSPTPGATGYRVTTHFRPILPTNNASGSFIFGVGFRQSSNGNIETHQWAFTPNSPNRFPIRHRYTANNTTTNPIYSFNSQIVGNNCDHYGNIWIRVERDTSTGNRRCYTSQDGLNFREIAAFASSTNDFITPDEVLILAWSSNDGVGGEQGIVCDSYEEEAY